MFKKSILCLLAGSILVMGLDSCASMSNTTKGTLIGSGAGAAVGAGVGALIGKNAKGTIIGAAVGTAVGGATGAIIGHKMDQKAAALKAAMEAQQAAATVETVEDSQGLKAIKVTFDADMSFAKNQANLSASAKNAIVSFAQTMAAEDMINTAIVVKGHTDSSGGDKINQPLSEKRAAAVGDVLRANSIAASRITQYGMASSEPKTDNAADAVNRRVEVFILATDAMVQQYAE
ncbi:MAG: OmpA family protein [Bacteroidales bacterium]|nr:OmpA family protein [Candidatus Liminaster caballi]